MEKAYSIEVRASDNSIQHIIPVRDFEKPSNAHKNSNLVLLCRGHHRMTEHLTVVEQCERLNIPQPDIQV